MIGHKPNIFWQATWRVVSPLIMVVILIFYFVTQVTKELTYLVWDPASVSILLQKCKRFPKLPQFTDIVKGQFLVINARFYLDFYIDEYKCVNCNIMFVCLFVFHQKQKSNFPTLAPTNFPSWIYVIIFILAGIPSLSIPLWAIFKFIRNKTCKKNSSKKSLDTISAKIQMSEKTKYDN